MKAKYVCAECGESDSAVIDFHHKYDKSFSIADAINYTYAEEKIIKELEKCESLCANCHRIRHWNNSKKSDLLAAKNATKAFVMEYKKNKVCAVCGNNCWLCLEFHHRDSANKIRSVSKMYGSNYSKKMVLEEMTKCDLICANCHRRLHVKERKASGPVV